MARWRAVPTAVSTAVGALAFLASTGLAIVLGAGLHVWSGPTTPGAAAGHGVLGPAPVTGRAGGVVTVTVAPPRLPATGPGVTPPTITLPFVPFTPRAVPASSNGGAGLPSPSGPGPVSTPVHLGNGNGNGNGNASGSDNGSGGAEFSLRELLARLSALRSSTHVALKPHQLAHARHKLRAEGDGDARHGARHHGRALGHGHIAGGHHGRGHGYAHAGGHRHHGDRHEAEGRHHHGHADARWHSHGRHHHHRHWHD